MRAKFAVEVLIFVAFAWAAPVWAHDIDEVRDTLRQKGFDQLEFSRTEPPFKLDACRGGERFHLQVDFYGKILEQTAAGSCSEDATAQPVTAPPPAATPPPANAARNEGSSIVTRDTPGPAQAPKPSRDADKRAKPAPAQELCSRYFPEVGKTMQVTCGR